VFGHLNSTATSVADVISRGSMARNRTFNEISVGDTATIRRVCTANDLVIFAHASGNRNPLSLPRDRDNDGVTDPDTIAPSMWVGSQISALLGNSLPGAGTRYRGQTLVFHERVHVGDELAITVVVTDKREPNTIILDCKLFNQKGELVAEGIADVLAPPESVDTPDADLPKLVVERHEKFTRMIRACQSLPPLATAVVFPTDRTSLSGAVLAAEASLIEPILIGPGDKIRALAKDLGVDISRFPIIEIARSEAAAIHAVELVHQGKVGAIMKGNLHSDELLHEVTKAGTGLRTARRISHVFVLDVPGMDHLLLISDAAINILPNLETKVDIVQNAIDMGLALGISQPRVGILSAVETVNPKIPSTLDAAILSKMAERGQIKGGIVDGPLAMDNAVDLEAARTKGIVSLVAGRADVLIVPNLEAGNMLAKELTFIAHADAAGLVLGAQVPVILTSRADDERSRLASCALAQLHQVFAKTGKPLAGLNTQEDRR
jgi:phosphate butyryltransferase